MSTSAAVHMEPAPIRACTVSRDVQRYDLLIEDMESIMGEDWGDLPYEDALAYLDQNDAETLEFIAIALDSDSEEELHDNRSNTLCGLSSARHPEKKECLCTAPAP